MKKISDFHESKNGLYLETGIISALVFLTIYGVKILNPTYTEWIYNGIDLTQHYLGWKAYRLSEWHFPIGLIDNISYPYMVSIIFTDSIPLFAVPFKVLSFLLPREFQYFGLWGLLCYILQGVLSVKIFSRFSRDRIVLILASSMMLFVPVVFQRMYYHSALAGQWVLLVGLDMLFDRKNDIDKIRYVKTIGVLALLSSMIHIYFVLMNGIIVCGIILRNILNRESVKKQIFYLCEYVGVAAGIVALMGGFTSGVDADNYGLGKYAFNLNGFINPAGYIGGTSQIFRELSVLAEWPDEGYTYLGAGYIAMFFVAVIIGILIIAKHEYVIVDVKRCVSISVIFIISIIFAASPMVAIGNNLIISMSLPVHIELFWSIFRATGRVAWVAMYILLIAMTITIISFFKKKWLVRVLLVLLLLIQIYDLNQIIYYKHDNYAKEQEYKPLLTSEEWQNVVKNEQVRHLVFMSDFNVYEKMLLANYAIDNKMTTSDFYFARTNKKRISEIRKRAICEKRDDTILLYDIEDRNIINPAEYDFKEADGFIIVIPKL